MNSDNFITHIFRGKFGADINSEDEIKLQQLFRKEEFKKKETIFQSFHS